MRSLYTTPIHQPKPFPFLLVLLFAAALDLSAAPLKFPKQGFTLDLPAEWKEIKPTPEGALSVAENASGSTKLVVVTKKMHPLDLAGVRAGVKKSMEESGMLMEPDQEFQVSQRPFVLIFGHHPTRNFTVANYLTGTESEVITLTFMIQGIPTAADPEIQSIVGGFQPLAPAPAIRPKVPPGKRP